MSLGLVACGNGGSKSSTVDSNHKHTWGEWVTTKEATCIEKGEKIMTDEQTLVVMSGHPMGLFKSHKMSPRVIITNALMVGMFDSNDNFNRAAAIGVANYGQMTAGGWMYIGPQGKFSLF